MKKLILPLLFSTLLVGCARFHTKQIDTYTSNEGSKTNGIPGIQTRSTEVSAYTIFSAKSSLATFKARQADASQNAEVGGLTQQGGTNAVAVLEAIAKILQAVPK